MVECLLSMYKVLGSTPSTEKKYHISYFSVALIKITMIKGPCRQMGLFEFTVPER